MNPEDSEDKAAEESKIESGSLKSVVTRVSTKRIAALLDSDHELSLAPAKRSQKDDDRSHEDRNCHSKVVWEVRLNWNQITTDEGPAGTSSS